MPEDIGLMAHLLRRAGFGATREELEAYAAKGYEATVEELLHPEIVPDMDYDLVYRRNPDWGEAASLHGNQDFWVYLMINTRRPLEEKIALFWHGILCVGYAKVIDGWPLKDNINLFRRLGLASFRDLLLELSRDPAMVFYLDNQLSHKGAINENWGRELLELFSLGVGMDGHPNYTEDDVKECARAFTGWSIYGDMPGYPYGKYPWRFKYDPTDHDDDEKTFLGQTGRWNGEDVIDILAHQPATARFVSRHLYNFFVADESQVPTWKDTPPRDMEAIKTLEKVYFDSHYDIRSMLRVLFNSGFFKNARFARVKNPAELTVGIVRLVGLFKEGLKPGVTEIAHSARYMGMDLLNPPTVEGWHFGRDWIDSGSLLERINFAADQVGNTDLPGVKEIVNRLAAQGTMSPQQLVEGCLDLMGPMEVSETTFNTLVDYALRGGELRNTTEEERIDLTRRVAETLQLIVATQEYQFC